jgi:hypothetical protein
MQIKVLLVSKSFIGLLYENLHIFAVLSIPEYRSRAIDLYSLKTGCYFNQNFLFRVVTSLVTMLLSNDIFRRQSLVNG